MKKTTDVVVTVAPLFRQSGGETVKAVYNKKALARPW
jgi:hypothetical protein